MSNQAWINLCALVIFLGGMAVVTGGFGLHHFKQKAEQELRESNAGNSLPIEIGPKKETILASSKNIWPQLEFGDSGALIHADDKAHMKLDLNRNEIVLVKEDGILKLSATIRDRDGSIIAKIVKNEWKTTDKSWDRNYSPDAAEVKNSKGDIVLQVRMMADRVQFSAQFYDAKGRIVVWGNPTPGRKGPGQIAFNEGDIPAFKIRPLFKYPSSTHLGEFADDVQ